MSYDLLPEHLWYLDILLLFVGTGLLMWLFSKVVYKRFGIKKLYFNSNQHVNNTHRKWDLTTRSVYLSIFVLIFLFTLAQNIYIPWIFLLLLPLYLIQTVLAAVMEWKHGRGRTVAIATIVQIGFFFSVVAFLVAILFLGIWRA
ncbi:DUF4181 domain-containing protein [Planococcus lenghuensis]|uniref:DUF4181 domain-containing protein n=1 Tax=Planococcus lenghuensis TaxID=2213202 RepID=A0A1Q2KVU3_9BACL|nr:DUF4181 domain-containing protein [Planococcus lenghuensis]AQQ52236.1 hypothetical protein B0X71_03330 [Planococcus lenghuensis]